MAAAFLMSAWCITLLQNYFLEIETKYRVIKSGFAATMIGLGYFPDSMGAQWVSVSAFSHSLSHFRAFLSSKIDDVLSCKPVANRADHGPINSKVVSDVCRQSNN